MPTKDFNPEDWTVLFNGVPIGKIVPESVSFSTPLGSNWYHDFMKELLPIEKEYEPELGFTRESYFENRRYRVRRVPIVHG